MKILGVDPGIEGGVALVDAKASKLLDALTVPTIGEDASRRVDALTLARWIVERAPDHCFLEHANAMPEQGVSSGFRFGRAVGALEATVMCCAVPLTRVAAVTWKREFGLAGPNKEQDRQRALELFPEAGALLARKKDHQRADAALIALFGARKLGGGLQRVRTSALNAVD